MTDWPNKTDGTPKMIWELTRPEQIEHFGCRVERIKIEARTNPAVFAKLLAYFA